MCQKVFPTYSVCGHNAKTNPDIVIAFFDGCKKRDCSTITEDNEEQHGLCPNCNSTDTFKHSYFSDACQVEFDHAYTDIPRLPDDEDVVLVTPIRGRCRLCVEHKYRVHPGDANRTIDAASSMPPEYQGLSRKSFAHVASSRPSLKASIVPLNMSVADFEKSQRPTTTTHQGVETSGATTKPECTVHNPGLSQDRQPALSKLSEVLPTVASESPSQPGTFHHGRGESRAFFARDDDSNMIYQTTPSGANRHSRTAKQSHQHETSDQSSSKSHKSTNGVETLPSSSRSHENTHDDHRIRSHTGQIRKCRNLINVLNRD